MFVCLDIDDLAKVATINRIANMAPSVPGLIQDDSHIQYCNSDNLPKSYEKGCDNRTVYYCSHRIELEKDKIYEFLIIDDTMNELDVSHPVHMHGYSFQIIDMGSIEQLIQHQTVFAKAKHPPVMKDTVTLPARGFVRIRFRTSNPGYWVS